MVTEKQSRLIRMLARQDVERRKPGGEPLTEADVAMMGRLVAFGVYVLEATRVDSWEMAALEADNAK